MEKKGENDEEKELTGGKEEGEVEVEEKVEGDDEDDDDEVHETPVNSLTLKQSTLHHPRTVATCTAVIFARIWREGGGRRGGAEIVN